MSGPLCQEGCGSVGWGCVFLRDDFGEKAPFGQGSECPRRRQLVEVIDM